MALFDDASLVVTPNGYKEGTLYSIKPTSGLGDMTVVRATTATRVNSAGLIELVPYNLIGYSEEFNNAYWALINGGTINANTITAPNGTLTADSLNVSTSTYSGISKAISGTSSVYTISIYAKKNTKNWLYFIDVTGSGARAWFDLDNGVLGTVQSGYTATITNVNNGWYRCTLTNSTAQTLAYYQLGLADANNSVTPTSSGSAYIWGAQLVEGTLPKDYLRTETRLNIPRLDYSNGSCPSLLVEPQRTNVKTNSENASGSNWGTAVRVNATINQIASPDGNITANSIADTAVSGTHAFEPSFSATSGTAYTFSVFAKANTLSQVVIYGYADNGVFAGQQAIFNITNGTVISNTGGGTTNVVNYGNGYYRVSLTLTSGATSTGYWAFGLAKNGSASYLGNGSSLYMWGCQLEAGSYPTSYIPTTSAAVTRNEDYLTRAGFGNSSISGTLFFDFYAKKIESSNGQYLLQLFEGSIITNATYSQTNGLSILANGNVIEIRNNAFTQTLQTITPTNNQRLKIAIRYNGTDISSAINGTLSNVLADSSVGVKNALRINNGESGTQAFNALVFFPSYLTNAELISLTT